MAATLQSETLSPVIQQVLETLSPAKQQVLKQYIKETNALKAKYLQTGSTKDRAAWIGKDFQRQRASFGLSPTGHPSPRGCPHKRSSNAREHCERTSTA